MLYSLELGIRIHLNTLLLLLIDNADIVHNYDIIGVKINDIYLY